MLVSFQCLNYLVINVMHNRKDNVYVGEWIFFPLRERTYVFLYNKIHHTKVPCASRLSIFQLIIMLKLQIQSPRAGGAWGFLTLTTISSVQSSVQRKVGEISVVLDPRAACHV